MNDIFIPYISQETINHKYFVYQNKGNKIAYKHWMLNTGLYPKKEKELEWIYSIIFEPLILYEKIYLTLEDYYYLLTKIDKGILREFLEEGIIKLIDTKSFRFSYYVKENDLLFMVDKSSCNTGFSKVFKKLPGNFKNKIRSNVIDLNNQDEFIQKVIDESNEDIKNQSFNNVKNLEMDAIKTNYHMNRIFYMNFFYALQGTIGIKNLYQDQVIFELLKNKFAKNNNINDFRIEKAFNKILDFNDLLDINQLVLNGSLKSKDILDLRENKSCVEFRKWLNNTIETHSISDSEEIVKAYHQACIEKSRLENIFDSNLYKSFSLVAGTALSTIPPIGIVYNIFDNFKDIIVKDWKPYYFINEIRNFSK